MTIPLLHAAPEASHANLQAGLLWGVAPEHLPALVAALLAPLMVRTYVAWQAAGADAGRPRAVRFIAGWKAMPLTTKVAAVLIATSAAIHAALIPHHLGDGSDLAVIFALDAVALTWLSRRIVAARRWRGLAIWLLIVNIGAYLGYVLAGTEHLDEVGMATKLADLTAIGLILVSPRRHVRTRARRVRRWAAVGSFLLLTLLTGVTTWAAAFHAEARARQALAEDGGAIVGHAMTGMVMQPAVWTEPTAAQRAAADRLVAATRDAIAPYEDPADAVAAGYTGEEGGIGAVVHYEHKGYLHDGVTLDPTRPEMLVYAITDRGAYLLGAVYAVPEPLADAPDAGGGSITAWHAHTNVCLGISGLTGLLSPFGACPAFSFNIAFGPMMHVWTVDLPGGPFGLEPEEEEIEAWLNG